ncbi:hypothetical protein ACLM5J_09715 [Nocardioides sp. Bht2]|uniref:hypothetical protein n=1 Tax=Nocardioides sp. Bht2 TaxID=3392297 RepID=UPI0039B61D62
MRVSQHAFHFGDLLISLGQQGGYADHGVFKLALLADGYEVGSPQQVVAQVESQLFDGDLEEITRYGNREMKFRVEVSAADGEALAQGEKALMAQLARPNTLRWLPPVPPVEATVFDVITSWMEVDSDGGADLDELRCIRVYEITARCMPFGRSETETITPALPPTGGPSPVVTVVNDCTSTSGWTATLNGAPTPVTLATSGTAVVAKAAGGVGADFTMTWTSGSAIPLAGTPWIALDCSPAMPFGRFGQSPTISINGGAPISPSVANGSKIYFLVAASSFTSIRISTSVISERGYAPALGVADIFRQDITPAIGTGRQLMRVLEVGGSAPTQGSLALEHSTAPLRQTVVYTNAEDGRGYQPPLRPFRASGGEVTPDATTVSGARSAMVTGTPEVYEAPMANLQAGEHAVLARVRATGTAGPRTFTRITTPRSGGESLDLQSHWTRPSISTAWQWVAMADALVTVDPAVAPNGVFRVSIESNLVDIDECLLLNMTTGSLVRVDAGASTRLWIDSPTVSDPRPRIRVGTAADGSDARHIAMDQVAEFSILGFEVGTMNVFTACEALNAACSLRHFERWHTHAAAS